MLTTTALAVSLDLGCCDNTDPELFAQMSSGKYDECAVMRLPAHIEDWQDARRTARKRAERAYRRGYVANVLERERYADDIYAINTSASHRQGRPMTDGYLHRGEFSPLPEFPCRRHSVRTTGVWSEDDHLVAYLVMHRQGDLALVSQILGHAAHEDQEVMYLLFEYALRREIVAHPHGYVVYNRWDSGTDGLRWFKERLGFGPHAVEWLP